MSNNRFIELYSGNRNRKFYPNISSFVVPFQQTGFKNTSKTAFDPIVYAFPNYIFKLNSISTNDNTPFSPVYNYPQVPAAPGSTYPFFTAPSAVNNTNFFFFNNSSYINNWYNGYNVILIENKETRTVFSYDGQSQIFSPDFPFTFKIISPPNQYYYFVTDPSIPFDEIVIDNKNIAGPTISGSADFPLLDFINSTIYPIGFNLPTTGIPSGYFKYFYLQIYDRTTGYLLQERIIKDFIQTAIGSTTYNVSLDGAFTIDWSLASRNNYYFVITPVLNNISNVLGKFDIPPLPYIHIQPVDIFDYNMPVNIDEFYVGKYVYNETTKEYRKIVNYNSRYKIASLESGFTPSAAFNPTNATIPPYADVTFSIRSEIPLVVDTFPQTSNINSNIIYLNPLTSPKRDNYWNGKYIYIRPYQFGYNDVQTSKNIYKINKYIGVVPPGSNPYAFVDKALELDAIVGNTYEIMNLSYDNYAPLCYTGSTVSQNELVCYEINLINLVIPNVKLTTGNVAYTYPYFYVQFGTYNSAMNYSKCVLYSNNQESNDALFICPTPDISDPVDTTFITLSGNGTQTVKFKPNDNLIFTIYLPSGELFKTAEEDDKSPQPPKPYLQLQGVFQIKRLNTS